MEQESGVFIKIGTAILLLLAIGFIAVVVAILFRPNQNAQEPTTVQLSIQEEEAIPEIQEEEDIPEHPEKEVSEPEPAPEGYDVYVVQRGATLSVIAIAFDVSKQDIKKANNLTSDMLQVGQRLIIPKKVKDAEGNHEQAVP